MCTNLLCCMLSCCSLRPIDVEFMQRLHHCVNIVPVIAKSDTLTVEERELFKQRVSHDMVDSGGEKLLTFPSIN